MKLRNILLPVSISLLGAPSANAVCLGSNETNNCLVSPGPLPPSLCAAGAADHVIICLSAPCVVSSGGGNDVVVGSNGADKICLGGDGLKVSESLAGADQNRGTGNTTNGPENYVLSGGSGSDINSLAGNADGVNVLLGGPGTDVNIGSTTSDRDICSSGDVNTNCEITVTN